MPQTATIKGLAAAFAMKAMQAEGVEWGEDYREAARQASNRGHNRENGQRYAHHRGNARRGVDQRIKPMPVFVRCDEISGPAS